MIVLRDKFSFNRSSAFYSYVYICIQKVISEALISLLRARLHILNISSSTRLFLFLLCIGDWGIRYHKQSYGFLMAKSANINDQKHLWWINESFCRVFYLNFLTRYIFLKHISVRRNNMKFIYVKYWCEKCGE